MEGHAQELAVLFPDRTATIADRVITMREYRFRESLQLAGVIQPLVAALADALEGGGDLTPEQLRPAFADRVDDVTRLIATACDQPPSWVAALDDEPGEELMLLWWVVNQHFFVRRVIERITAARLKRSLGWTPSPSWGDAATTPPSSAITPCAS